MYTIQCYHRIRLLIRGKCTQNAYLDGGMKRHRKSMRIYKERLGTPVRKFKAQDWSGWDGYESFQVVFSKI